MVQSQFQAQIRMLRTNNGRENFNSILGEYLSQHEIIHQSSCVDTPQQNEVSKRKNRHLLEVSRALMFTMNIPKYLWGDTVLTSSYLINRLPSRPLKFNTPLSVLTKHNPQVFKPHDIPLKTFGCTAFVHLHNQVQSKLDPRAVKTVFVGYSPTKKGHRCYCPLTRKVYASYDVIFFEDTPYFSSASIQEENKGGESRIWDVLDLPLPNDPSLPTDSSPSCPLPYFNSPNNSSSRTFSSSSSIPSSSSTPSSPSSPLPVIQSKHMFLDKKNYKFTLEETILRLRKKS